MSTRDEDNPDSLLSPFVWAGFETPLNIGDFSLTQAIPYVPINSPQSDLKSIDSIEEFVPQSIRLEREKSSLRKVLEAYISNFNNASLILHLSNNSQGQDGVIRAVCEQFGQLSCFASEFMDLGVVFVSFTDFASAAVAREVIDRDYSQKYGVRASFCSYLPPAFTSLDISDPFSFTVEFTCTISLAPSYKRIELDQTLFNTLRMCIGDAPIRSASISVGEVDDDDGELKMMMMNVVKLTLSFFSFDDCQSSLFYFNQINYHYHAPIVVHLVDYVVMNLPSSLASTGMQLMLSSSRQARVSNKVHRTCVELRNLLELKQKLVRSSSSSLKSSSSSSRRIAGHSHLIQLFDSRHSSSINDEDDYAVVSPGAAADDVDYVNLNQYHTSLPISPSSASPTSGNLYLLDDYHHHQMPNQRRLLLSSSSSSARQLISSPSSYEVDNVIDIDKISNNSDTRTSIMIRNIPNKYTQQMLLSEFCEIGLAGKFDFFYIPIDFKNRCNVGYAFMNLINYSDIVFLYSSLSNKRWKSFNSDKVCSISYAKIQGKAALVSRFQNSTLMDREDSFKPLIFYSSGPLIGQSEPFPLPSRSHLMNKGSILSKRTFLSCDEIQWP